MAWMFRTVLDNLSFLNGLSDAGIAMISALFLFLFPSGNKEKRCAPGVEGCTRKCSVGIISSIRRRLESS